MNKILFVLSVLCLSGSVCTKISTPEEEARKSMNELISLTEIMTKRIENVKTEQEAATVMLEFSVKAKKIIDTRKFLEKNYSELREIEMNPLFLNETSRFKTVFMTYENAQAVTCGKYPDSKIINSAFDAFVKVFR
ncbi:MAG TPA: hypothetical protein PK419_05535 [Spirochaetota bacterium]|jgi:transposase-like protein|nr:hypothetical protein [Spirochaetota bacterium]HPY03055.1 hypothetical protein [Spirochaetota bacterium]HQA52296.1 hypothetical protein [Spirochaetota bacterium]